MHHPPHRANGSSRGGDKIVSHNHKPDESSGLLSADDIRSFDGTGNNLTNPNLNVANTDEARIAPANFAPGTTNTPIAGPNPRDISNIIASGPNADLHDPAGLSAFMYVWGQFVDHDLDRTPVTGTDHIDIAISDNDPTFPNGGVISLTRGVVDPATGNAINIVTGWQDASMVYGSDAQTAASLRLPDGHMLTSEGNNLPIVNGAFAGGDIRVSENPDLTAVNTLFVREHNYQVDRLQQQHPDWTGDQLYQMARAIVTAEIQNITYSEYLPRLLGPDAISAYRGYDPTVDPRITEEFATAAFRFGHSIVSGEETKIDDQGNELSSQSLADAFFATPAEVAANGGVDALLRNFAADVTQANDVYVIEDLRNLLSAPPAQIDLIAIDIQRERDMGLGTLNQTRAALGLQPYTEFSQITGDPEVQARLQQAFGSVDSVDLFIGGLAEDHVSGAMLGTTFNAIVAKQFIALRDGDRLWWQNQGFDDATAQQIQNTTLADVMMRNIATTALQYDVFVAAERHPSDAEAEDPTAPQLVMGIDSDGAVIAGGPADDTIVAGLGHDQTLTGGGGSNVFVFRGTDQHVTITDYAPGLDKLDFQLTAGDFHVSTRSSDGHAVVQYGGTTIDLLGVSRDQIARADLVLPGNQSLV
jgi:peroxidase